MGNQLPIEVACVITAHLEIKDVLSLRLCSRTFAHAGIRSLPGHTTLYSHSGCRQRFSAVLQNAEICKHIESLTIDIYYIPTNFDERSYLELHEYMWKAGFTDRFEYKRRRAAMVSARLPFRNEVRAQRLMLRHNEHHALWQTALSKLTKLKSLTVSGHRYRDESRDKFFGVLHLFCVAGKWFEDWSAINLFLSDSQSTLQSLTIDQAFQSIFADKNVEHLMLKGKGFQTLTSLKLDIWPSLRDLGLGADEDVRDDREGFKQCVLQRAVCGMKALRNVSIRTLTGDNHPWLGWPIFTDVFDEQQTWPNLEEVFLVGFWTEQQQLSSFLKRHQNTMTTLKLHAPSTDESWPAILQSLQKSANLKHISLLGRLRGRVDENFVFQEQWSVWPQGHEQLNSGLSEHIAEHDLLRFISHGDICPLMRDNMSASDSDQFIREISDWE